jgi:cation diffusion facilitator CzcD-associated flavoprotein CzcO
MISNPIDVAIIGAGPYGLSIAAHLRANGVSFRIFGEPMMNWRSRMPKGMHLKSDGFASSLFDPDRRCTLRQYCHDRGIPYADLGRPVPVETFWSYGLAFQKQMVPSLDTRWVANLESIPNGFGLTLSDGERLQARRVIVATGISYFEYVPEELRGLPRSHCSHAADNHDLSGYKNREVLVLGRGASSTDIAALLVDQGASVQIVSREPVIFHLPPGKKPRSLWKRILDPNLGLGPSRRSAVYTAFAGQFRFLPVRLRQRIVRRHLGPAGGWFIREKLEAHVPMRSGYVLKGAEVKDNRVHVQFAHRDGSTLETVTDHVIAGTGYRIDLSRLPFLGDELRGRITLEGTTPVLSANFESSVPGLYFVGLCSAVTFGPLTRFAHGAGFTARRISRHLRRHRSRSTTKELLSASS